MVGLMREPAFDLAKFLAMVFVVVGHMVPNGVVSNAHMPVLASNVIVGVSMPLFFIISGYFSRRRLLDGAWTENLARLCCLLWPLFAFGVLFAGVMYGCGQLSTLKAVTYPFGHVVGGGWFLRTLALVYLFVYIICRIFKGRTQRWVAVALAYAVLVFMPKYSLGNEGVPLIARVMTFWMGEVMHMFPYFVFGLFVLRPRQWHRHSLTSCLCGLFFLVIVLLEGNVAKNGMGFYWVSANGLDMFATGRGALCFFGRTLVGITGSVFLIWMLGVVLNRVGGMVNLAVFGTTTLGVYVMHEWLLKELGMLPGFPAPWWMLWPLTLFVFFFCHWLTRRIQGSSHIKLLLFGDEKWISSLLSRIAMRGGAR